MSLEPPTTTDQPAGEPPPSDPSVGSDGAPATPLHDPAQVAQERAELSGVVGSPWGRALRLGALVALVVLLGVSQGLSMLIVVAAIVIMIFLHELGHYVMAKRAGMLVTEFFLGFGPRIWSFQRGETEYGIKAIPAGAYVKIIGMSNMEEVDPALESRTYRQKSFGQRVGVAVAGSTMHFLIAFVLLFVQFAFIGDPTTDRWAVGAVTPGSAADVAGLQEGDEIRSFDGSAVPTFDAFREEISAAGPGTVELVVLRDGQDVTVPVTLSQRAKLIGTIGEDVDVLDTGSRLLVGAPYDGGEAEAAGLVGGATLVAVNGEQVSNLDEVVEAAEASNAGVVTLTTADEAGTTSEHRIDLGTQLGTTEPAAFVGVGQERVMETTGPVEAFVGSAQAFGETVVLSVGGVARFVWPPNLIGFIGDAVTGSADENATDTPTEAASTPASESESRPISIFGVAALGSDLAAQDLSSLVMFLAALNIFIGVFNLFPMLPFDGGHVVIAFYEKAQELRRRTNQRYLADVSRLVPVAYGVVIVLAVVGLLAIYLDITQPISL
jgi:RIP metalloprotease RseP